MNHLIYIASPFTSRRPYNENEEEFQRYKAVCRYAAHCTRLGEWVYSPIAHSYGLHVYGGLGGDWEAWREIDRKWLSIASELRILCLPGWEQSGGIRGEIELVGELNNTTRRESKLRITEIRDVEEWL